MCVCVCVCFVINASFLLTVISIMPAAVPSSPTLYRLLCSIWTARVANRDLYIPFRHFSHLPSGYTHIYCYAPSISIKNHENSINFTVTPVKHCTVAACSVDVPDAVLGSSVRIEINQNFLTTIPPTPPPVLVVPLVCWHFALGAMFSAYRIRPWWGSTVTSPLPLPLDSAT